MPVDAETECAAWHLRRQGMVVHHRETRIDLRDAAVVRLQLAGNLPSALLHGAVDRNLHRLSAVERATDRQVDHVSGEARHLQRAARGDAVLRHVANHEDGTFALSLAHDAERIARLRLDAQGVGLGRGERAAQRREADLPRLAVPLRAVDAEDVELVELRGVELRLEPHLGRERREELPVRAARELGENHFRLRRTEVARLGLEDDLVRAAERLHAREAAVAHEEVLSVGHGHDERVARPLATRRHMDLIPIHAVPERGNLLLVRNRGAHLTATQPHDGQYNHGHSGTTLHYLLFHFLMPFIPHIYSQSARGLSGSTSRMGQTISFPSFCFSKS